MTEIFDEELRVAIQTLLQLVEEEVDRLPVAVCGCLKSLFFHFGNRIYAFYTAAVVSKLPAPCF